MQHKKIQFLLFSNCFTDPEDSYKVACSLKFLEFVKKPIQELPFPIRHPKEKFWSITFKFLSGSETINVQNYNFFFLCFKINFAL